MLGGRPASFVARQLLEPANYRSLWTIPRVSTQPLRFARAYFLGGGVYPWRCGVRTPQGVVSPTTYSHHDVFTVQEIFCRTAGSVDEPPPPVRGYGSRRAATVGQG